MKSDATGVREVDTGEVYRAPEEDLERFLKMVSGEVREVTLPPKPIIEEKEVVKPEPEIVVPELEIEVPAEVEPEIVVPEEVEEVEEPIGEPLKIERRLHIPPISQMSLSELQRAIVLSEILGLPRAMKKYEYPKQ